MGALERHAVLADALSAPAPLAVDVRAHLETRSADCVLTVSSTGLRFRYDSLRVPGRRAATPTESCSAGHPVTRYPTSATP